MSKAEMVRKLKKTYACEDYFPGVLGNPVTFAARWGLPLSKNYLNSFGARGTEHGAAPA